jgi:RsiW-degrading membrane proteinase PrsW (M82 family)
VRLGIPVYLAAAVGSIGVLLAWLAIPPDLTGELIESRNLLARLVGFVAGVGLREEAAKALPVVVLVWWRSKIGLPRLSLRQGVFLGALAGLAFAAAENAHYLRQFDSYDRLAQFYGVFTRRSLEGSMLRLLLTPFMHGAWSAIAGYFIVWGAASGARSSIWASGLVAAAILHGIYDFVADVPVLALLAIAFTFHVFTRCVGKAAGGVTATERLDRLAA